MKLSMESFVPVRRFGDKDGLKLIKDAGFDCVDMSYTDIKLDAPLLGDGYIEYAHSIREYLGEIGLGCDQAHAPYVMNYESKFDLDDINYRATVRSIESAAIIGAKVIVVHTIAVPKSIKEFTMWELNQRYYKSLLPYAEKAGICIAVENLYSYDDEKGGFVGRLGSPEELSRFVKEVNSPYVVACVDTGHASISGYKPEEFIEGMDASVLSAVHLHDGDYEGDRHMLPFLGRFHWPEILAALKKKNFQGNLNLEIVTYLIRVPKELLPEALRLAAKTGRYMVDLYDSI